MLPAILGQPKSPQVAAPSGESAAVGGFSTLVVQDHVSPQLAPLLALVSAATVTTTLRLGTINPAPLLARLQAAGIEYACVNPLMEGEANDIYHR